MWLLLINHIQNGHVSVPYHVNMHAFRFIQTKVLMRGSSIKVFDSEGVFTLSRQVCVNMRLVKYKTGLLPLLSQTKQIQITRTAEMGGICFVSLLLHVYV